VACTDKKTAKKTKFREVSESPEEESLDPSLKRGNSYLSEYSFNSERKKNPYIA